MRLKIVGIVISVLLFTTAQSRVIHKKANNAGADRKPIVIVPGMLGTRLQAKLDIKSPLYYNCDSKANWYDIWLNLEEFLPYIINCWVADISMIYSGTRQPTNSDGVDIRVEDFGGTSSFEYLDSNHDAVGSPYFNKLVEYLVLLGYKRRDDLKGAPYDWRLTPSLHPMLMQNITRLIEDNYYNHSNRKVVLIGHSMGNLFIYVFLKHKPQAWKDKFIDSFISVSSPYIGSVKALKAVVSGETEGHDSIVNRLKIRKAERTFPSSYFLLPRPSLWPKDKAKVVYTDTYNYTVHDYEILSKNMRCKECWDRWRYFGNELGDLVAPQVEVHCVYSSGMPTIEAMQFGRSLFPDYPSIIESMDGDGSVSMFSSSYCLKWREQQKQPVHDVHIPKLGHVDILSSYKLHDYIRDVVAASRSWVDHFKSHFVVQTVGKSPIRFETHP